MSDDEDVLYRCEWMLEWERLLMGRQDNENKRQYIRLEGKKDKTNSEC